MTGDGSINGVGVHIESGGLSDMVVGKTRGVHIRLVS